MTQRELIDFLQLIGKLKVNTRHCWTTEDRQESVAEHSWRLALMPLLIAEHYPDTDINKVVKMCLIHDFGEALTGDIPAFFKTEAHEETEEKATEKILSMLSSPVKEEFSALFDEMEAMETPEAKLFKALDNLEAVVSHNEADISSWIEMEYTENLRYGKETAAFSEYTAKLREVLTEDGIEKIKREGKDR